MKFLIFIPQKDFRDETVSMLKLFFDKWDVGYQITSFTTKECMGSHGAVYTPTLHTGKASAADFDGIVLVDGKGVDEYRLYEYRPLLDILLQFSIKNKKVAGIGNAIKALARANIIKDKKISMPRDEEARRMVLLFHGVASQNAAEISGNIVTIGDSANLERAMQEVLGGLGVM